MGQSTVISEQLIDDTAVLQITQGLLYQVSFSVAGDFVPFCKAIEPLFLSQCVSRLQLKLPAPRVVPPRSIDSRTADELAAAETMRMWAMGVRGVHHTSRVAQNTQHTEVASTY